jgi:hypothetical protein
MLGEPLHELRLLILEETLPASTGVDSRQHDPEGARLRSKGLIEVDEALHGANYLIIALIERLISSIIRPLALFLG